MIDCLIIHPAGAHGIYGPLGDQLTALEQPLWPRLIAGYLLDRGFKTQIIDMEVGRLSLKDVTKHINELHPRLIAIVVQGHQPSASTQSMPAMREIALYLHTHVNEIGELYPPIVVIGNHISALPERTLREEPVDFVVDGEGPVTIDGLLQIVGSEKEDDDSELARIPGLVWYNDFGDIIRNPLAPLLDLDKDLHGRAWNLLPPPSSYRAHNWQCLSGETRSPYAAIYTSLGCSYTCSFCMINVFQHTNRYRMRSPATVVEEIWYLYREHGVKVFKIVDELFCLNRNHVREICQGLRDCHDIKDGSRLGDNINIWAYARTDTVHTENLPLMRAAGIKWLALGIESGSAAVRASIDKKLRNDDGINRGIWNTVKAIHDADINVIGNYIFGLPEDDLDSMGRTLELAQNLNTEWANFYTCMAYPGSKLYDHAITENWTLPATWAGYSQHNRYTHPLDTEHIDAKTVLHFRDEALIIYFSSQHYRDMIKRKFGEQAIEQINKMLEYNLERDLLK